MAADGLIVPVAPEPLAVEALETLLATIERVRARMTPRGRMVGILLTLVDPQRKHTRDIADRLRAAHRDSVFHTEIRCAAVLAEAPAARKTIAAVAPKSAVRRSVQTPRRRSPAAPSRPPPLTSAPY